MERKEGHDVGLGRMKGKPSMLAKEETVLSLLSAYHRTIGTKGLGRTSKLSLPPFSSGSPSYIRKKIHEQATVEHILMGV